MNKTDLVNHIKNTAGLSAAAANKALDAVLDTIQKTLGRGEDITLTGFGSFAVTTRSARQGRNPKTGQAISIAASRQVRFRAGKTLKEAVA
ncbi:MAG: HU family DNA-binding protein [Alphaproteobacteria bacterium]|nr:HU family DNA-binding protein [Alphaproteobacteria bacterium]